LHGGCNPSPRAKSSPMSMICSSSLPSNGPGKHDIGQTPIPLVVTRRQISQLEKLELSLSDIHKTLNEANIGNVITSLRSHVAKEFGPAIGGAGLGAKMLPSFFNCSEMTAGLIGAGIALTIKLIIMPTLNGSRTPFTYLNSIRKELGK
ncbi:MAG: hypothetical protein V1806_13540, partial [Pseudomonadota bacterium]